jgi:multiple sugar transport system substrate-binding protein
VYGYPWLLGTRVLFYNKDLMFRAGIDSTAPPSTWTEWLRQARAIDSLGTNVHGFAANTFERHRLYKKFLPLFWSAGGELFTDDGDCALDSDKGVRALSFYVDLCNVGLFDVQRELDLAFQQGRIGFTLSGDWLLQQLRRDPKAPHFGLALVPHPDSGESVSFAGGEYLVVPKKSAHAQEAQLFVDFLLRPENNLKLCRAIGFIPAHTAAARNAYFTEDPLLHVFVKQLEQSRSTPVHPKWVEIEEIIEGAVERAMYKGTTPDSALQRACSDITALLAR